MDEYSEMNNTFAALADPTRRAILQQLMDGPARVTELARPHDISLNSVSKHLKLLEKADLVIMASRGHDSLSEEIFGSTTERVVRHASCPVLVA